MEEGHTTPPAIYTIICLVAPEQGRRELRKRARQLPPALRLLLGIHTDRGGARRLGSYGRIFMHWLLRCSCSCLVLLACEVYFIELLIEYMYIKINLKVLLNLPSFLQLLSCFALMVYILLDLSLWLQFACSVESLMRGLLFLFILYI